MKNYPCPKCGEEMECDTVDNGVGMEQCGPYGCPSCHYVDERMFLPDLAPSAPEAPKAEATRSASPQLPYAELREALAGLCHAQWSGWMVYLFSRCFFTSDGAAFMEVSDTRRWQIQMNTQYDDLSESEKESDRIEADRIIELIDSEAERAGMDDVVSAGSPSDLARGVVLTDERYAELTAAEAELATLRSTHATLQSALRELVAVIEADELMPPTLSYFKQAKDALNSRK